VLNFSDILPLLPYIGQNIALFCGGLFAGAAIYVSLTECPPRSVLGLRELMLLAYTIGARTNALLLALSALTAVCALLVALAGGWNLWISGGLTHLAATAFLLTDVRSVTKRLESLNPYEDEEAGGKLMQRRAGQIAILALLGLAAQYQFLLA
jgi:hypothetical protein